MKNADLPEERFTDNGCVGIIILFGEVNFKTWYSSTRSIVGGWV